MDFVRKTFEIEDDVPVPDGPNHESRTVYPLANMLPKQSFFVPTDETVTMKVLQNRIKAAIGGAQRRMSGSSYTWRAVEEATVDERRLAQEEGREPRKVPGIRVWRQV